MSRVVVCMIFFLEYEGELLIIVLIEESLYIDPKHTPTPPLTCKTLIAYCCWERPDHTLYVWFSTILFIFNSAAPLNLELSRVCFPFASIKWSCKAENSVYSLFCLLPSNASPKGWVFLFSLKHRILRPWVCILQPSVTVCDLDDNLTANHLRLRFPELVSPTHVTLCSKRGGGLAPDSSGNPTSISDQTPSRINHGLKGGRIEQEREGNIPFLACNKLLPVDPAVTWNTPSAHPSTNRS